jgi:hypothetical protein
MSSNPEHELRVPPAVTLQFERFALEVCEEAKLDFDQWASKTHELVGHLQQLWRQGIERGLNTDDASAHAFAVFGSVATVGRSFRPPWIRRFLLWRRYQGQRYALFLSAAVLCAYAAAGRMSAANPDTFKSGSVGFFYLLGTSLNGAVALGSLLLVQWRPTIRSQPGKALFACRWLVAPFILTGIFNVLLPAFVTFPLVAYGALTRPANLPSAVWEGVVAAFGLLGGLGYLSELFRFPQRRSDKVQKELVAMMPG